MKDNNKINVIEMLRDKTEEADLEHLLKSKFGGYTKQSVKEYFSAIKKQQQTTKDTFAKNLQTLFEEKESLRKNNESLITRYNKLLAEHDNLSESLKNIKINNSEISAQDIFSFKANIVSLESELKKSQDEKRLLEKTNNQLNHNIQEMTNRLNHANEETRSQQEMLIAERRESQKQRDMIVDLSRQIDEDKSEIKYLKSTLSEGRYAELSSKVDELNEQLVTQTEVISKLNLQCKLKDNTINTLNNEVVTLKQRLDMMVQTMQKVDLQNDKLIVANDLLKEQLQEEYNKFIDIINEKADVSIERLIAQKKLYNAESKIISLQLQLDKLAKSEEVHETKRKLAEFESINNKLEKTDKIIGEKEDKVSKSMS